MSRHFPISRRLKVHLTPGWLGSLLLVLIALGLIGVASLDPPALAPYGPKAIGAGQYVLADLPFGGDVWHDNMRNGMPAELVQGENETHWRALFVASSLTPGALVTLPRTLPRMTPDVLLLALALFVAAIALRVLSPRLGWVALFSSLALASANLLGRYPEPFSALLWLSPLFVAAAAGLEIRRAWRVTAGIGLALLVTGLMIAVFLAEQPGGDAPSLLGPAPLLAGGIILAFVLGLQLQDAFVRVRQQNSGKLRLANVVNELVPGRSAARLTTIEEERGRLALEIHDTVLPSLTAMSRRLEAASPTEAENLRQVAGVLRSQMSERRLVTLEALGLGPALRELIERLEREVRDATVRISLHSDSGERLPTQVELATYRIAQQALLNALEHAVGATQIEMRLDIAPNGSGAGRGLTLTVRDDGRGLTPGELQTAVRANHLGFAEMRTRAASVDGQLDIGPAQEQAPRGLEVRFQWVA